MLLRLVCPVKRSGSSIPQFVQRILADVRQRAIGWKLTIRRGTTDMASVRIRERTDAARFSLQTRDPAEAKMGCSR
jgi:hypothetical protein